VAAAPRYLSPPLSERAIDAYTRLAPSTPIDPFQLLTPREREVLRLLAEGYTNTAVADRLHISPRTAETHRANLMRKLGLRSQVELGRFAVERGILPAVSLSPTTPERHRAPTNRGRPPRQVHGLSDPGLVAESSAPPTCP
jgi:DNA-binding CsgD family transcriptional regulator